MLAMLAAFAASGCWFDLVPTRDELSRSGGIAARVVKLKSWGTPVAAFVEIASESDAHLAGAVLAAADSPCGRGARAFIVGTGPEGEVSSWLDDLWAPSPEAVLAPDRALLPAGKTIAKVSLPRSLVALAERELALDLMIGSPAGEPPGCLRVPLRGGPAADGDWRIVGGRLFGSMSLRRSAPIGSSAGPSSVGLDMEFGRQYGRLRLNMRVDLGLALCDAACPLSRAAGELSHYVGMGFGTEVLLLRAERWLIGAELGYRFRVFRELGNGSGPVRAVQHAPWIGLRLLRTSPPLPRFLHRCAGARSASSWPWSGCQATPVPARSSSPASCISGREVRDWTITTLVISKNCARTKAYRAVTPHARNCHGNAIRRVRFVV